MATDDDAPPDAAPAPAEDRRAKELGPAELAELAAWFSLPSAEVLVEQQQRTAEESAEEAEWRETNERRAKASAAVDPAFLARILLHETTPPPVTPMMPVELTIDDRKMVMAVVSHELDRIERGEAADGERAFNVPQDIVNAVETNTPQAILRDLYRPVMEYDLRFESPFSELPDLSVHRATREAMRTDFTKVEWNVSPMGGLDEIHREFREILSAPWAELAEAAKATRDATVAELDEGR